MYSIYSKHSFVKRVRKKIHPPSKMDSGCNFYGFYSALIAVLMRSAASLVFSASPKAVRRK